MLSFVNNNTNCNELSDNINNAFNILAESDSESDLESFDFDINYISILNDDKQKEIDKKRNKWKLKRQAEKFIELMEPNSNDKDYDLAIIKIKQVLLPFLKLCKSNYEDINIDINIDNMDYDSIIIIFELLELIEETAKEKEKSELNNVIINLVKELKILLTNIKTKTKKKVSLIETSQKKECREIKLCKQILKKNGPYDGLNQNQKKLLIECKKVKKLLNLLIEYKLLYNVDNLELHDLDISNIMFTNNICVEIKETNFSGSNLSKSNFTKIIFTNVIMENIKAISTIFYNCTFYNMEFVDSDLSNTSFHSCIFHNVKFKNSYLNNINACSSKFINCEFIHTQFNDANCENIFVVKTLFLNCILGSNYNTKFNASQFKNTIFESGSIIGANFYDSVHLHCKFINLTVNENDFKNAIFINTIQPQFIK
jgi:uncharacterized protein YjbI with pentapeptide repeats